MPRTKDPTLHTDLAKQQTYAAYQLVRSKRESVANNISELRRELVTLERQEEQLRKSLNVLRISVVDGHDITNQESDDDGA